MSTTIPQNCTWVGGVSPADLDDIPAREGAADAAKPVTAQAAAPVGDTTSRSLEGDASDSAAPRQMAEPVVPTGNEGTPGEREPITQPVAA